MKGKGKTEVEWSGSFTVHISAKNITGNEAMVRNKDLYGFT
jgi:hypothetical protein